MDPTTELLHARPPQRKISLTPLVDVIFLLLIFFMLTSQIAPFSLISLSGTKAENTPSSALPKPVVQNQNPAPARALISISRAKIAINGIPIQENDIQSTLENLLASGVESAIISPRSSATVQDLVGILEALKKLEFKSISIRSSG